MKRKETLREYINRRSFGAYVTFEFDTERIPNPCFRHEYQYTCISVKDFITEYGRRSEHILDDYIVIGEGGTEPSNSQGQTLWLTLQKKSEYVETLEPVKLTPFEVEEIVNKLEEIKNMIKEAFPEYDEEDPAIEKINCIIEKLGE